MPVTEGYVVEERGVCSITGDINEGPFVRSPYMVTQQMVGRPLYIGAPTIRAFGSAIHLVPIEVYDELLDERDQRIADLEAANKVLTEENNGLTYAANRWHALKAHEQGDDIERQLAEANEKIAKQAKQLQQLNMGGRPKKTETKEQIPA